MFRHLFQKRHRPLWVLSLVRNTAMIVRALYGLNSAGVAFRSHLARCMESLGYVSCRADLDLWLIPEIRPEDEMQNFSYYVCYVDDILCIHHYADDVLQHSHKSLLDKSRFGKPSIYLDVKLQKTSLYNGV